MLKIIRDPQDPLLALVADDPVRPHIDPLLRITPPNLIFALVGADADSPPSAMVCVAFVQDVPHDEAGLWISADQPQVAVFYTVWSYLPGSGRDIIFAVREWILANCPKITRFVTLSPPTEMARRFHMKNGASVFRVNADSVNYEYPGRLDQDPVGPDHSQQLPVSLDPQPPATAHSSVADHQ